MLNIYITSSQRKCGKTFVSAGLASTMQSLGYSTSVYKPIQTAGISRNGFSQSPDLTYVKSIDPYINTHFTYLFNSDCEPLIASELENNPINIDLIINELKKTSSIFDCTILDGDNGILSPIAPNYTNLDFIKRAKIPVLIVTTPSVDSINSTLTTVNTLENSSIQIRGVLINNIQKDCSRQLLASISRIIEEYSNAKILGLVENLGTNPSPQDVITATLNGIDIESVFDVKIEKLDFA